MFLKWDMLFRRQIWIKDKRECLSFSFSQYLIHPNKKNPQGTTQFIFNNPNIEYLKLFKWFKKHCALMICSLKLYIAVLYVRNVLHSALWQLLYPERKAPDEDRWAQPPKRRDNNNEAEDSWVHAKAVTILVTTRTLILNVHELHGNYELQGIY